MTVARAMTDRRLRHGRAALAVSFSVQGMVFALLVTRIPALQDRYGIPDGLLPVFLAAVPVLAGAGSVATEPLARRFGAGAVLRWTQPVVGVALVAAGSGGAVWQLAVALAVFGLAVGALDASMNMVGVNLQRAYGRSVMLGFHAAYSLGGILGACAAWAGARADLPLPALYAPAVALVVPAAFLAARWFPADGPGTPASGPGSPGRAAAGPGGGRAGASRPARPGSARPGSARPGSARPGSARPGSATPASGGSGPATPGPGASGPGGRVPLRPLLPLCLVMTFAYIGDSTVANWSAKYLEDVLHGSEELATVPYNLYMVTTLAGRCCGDLAVRRFGMVAVVRCGTVLAAGGFAVVAAAPGPWVGLCGFTLLGLGLCVVVPATFAAAGRLFPGASDSAVARLNIFNYLGFLIGSPLVGALGEVWSHRGAMLLPMVLVLATLLYVRSYPGDPDRYGDGHERPRTVDVG